MTIEGSWLEVDAAIAKYGIGREKLCRWIADGIIRTEEGRDKVLRINIDDLDLKIQEITGL